MRGPKCFSLIGWDWLTRPLRKVAQSEKPFSSQGITLSGKLGLVYSTHLHLACIYIGEINR